MLLYVWVVYSFFSPEIGLLLMLMESQIYLCRLKSDLNQSFVVWQSHFPWLSGPFPIILCTQEWLPDTVWTNEKKRELCWRIFRKDLTLIYKKRGRNTTLSYSSPTVCFFPSSRSLPLDKWCLELWNTFCKHEGKAKRTVERKSQNPVIFNLSTNFQAAHLQVSLYYNDWMCLLFKLFYHVVSSPWHFLLRKCHPKWSQYGLELQLTVLEF